MTEVRWDHTLLYQFYFHYKLLLGCVKVEWLIQLSRRLFLVKNSTQIRI